MVIGKSTFSILIGVFGVSLGMVESGSFFFPGSDLNSSLVFLILIVVSSTIALFRCAYEYKNFAPLGLENEKKDICKIAHLKKPYWEYALVCELLRQRIEKIDQDLDDLINNRVHVGITRSLNVVDYIQWIGTRPDNLLGMVDAAKQLLIFDLGLALQTKKNEDIDFKNLVK